MTRHELVLLDDFRRASSCPVNWTEQMRLSPDMNHARHILDLEWARVVGEVTADPAEASIIEELQQFGQLVYSDPLCLGPHTKNLDYCRARAIALYEAGAGRLADLRFLRPSQHDKSKHFRRSVSPQNLASQTAGGAPSLFLIDHTVEDLATAFWSWFLYAFGILDGARYRDPPAERFRFAGVTPTWDLIVNGSDSFRIAFATMNDIGASNGQLTRFVCYDLYLGAGIRMGHAYPIDEPTAIAINQHQIPMLGVEFGAQ